MSSEIKVNGKVIAKGIPDIKGVHEIESDEWGSLIVDLNNLPNVIIDCSKCPVLQGRKGNKTESVRTITLGRQGKGSQQINPVSIVEYDLGHETDIPPKKQRIRHERYLREYC